MSEGRFLTLSGPGEAETRVRASRFLALAAPARDEAEARGLVENRTAIHFDARHHCAAWRFREGHWRTLDAGEPAGSAGAPILAAIDAAALVDTAVVVTRYFGGTKLGIGGLARAYGEAAGAALEAAPKRAGTKAVRVEIEYDFAHTSAVMRSLESIHSADLEHRFSGETGLAQLHVTVPDDTVAELREALRERSAGSVDLRVSRHTVLYLPV